MSHLGDAESGNLFHSIQHETGAQLWNRCGMPLSALIISTNGVHSSQVHARFEVLIQFCYTSAMRFAAASCLAFSLLLTAGAQKQKKPPDVQIVETKAVRETSKITVDGKVKAT